MLWGLSIGFLVLGTIFLAIERLSPGIAGQKLVRRGWWTDLAYWFFTPLVSKTITEIVLLIGATILLAMLGRTLSKESIMNGYGWVGQLPLGLQFVLILALTDLIGYWSHRLFHRGRLWKFHAVHHCSEELDWLSSVRLHPVNEVVSRVLASLPLVALGFAAKAVVFAAPVLTFYAIFIHANVNWGFGPLKYVIATPLFHRWHHSKERDAIDTNFAGLLPLWDILFGTFYMPPGKFPTEFGVADPVPEGIVGQLAYPFKP